MMESLTHEQVLKKIAEHDASSCSRIQKIFRLAGDSVLSDASLNLSPEQKKLIHDIQQCRTSACGFRIDLCTECGTTRFSYNSCGNRNCPVCGAWKKEAWIDTRSSEVIDAPYYHAVFTCPHELSPLILANQKLLYALYQKCAGAAIMELAADEKYLGAMPGVILVLHTWNQELLFHPHVHALISGGGLAADGSLRTLDTDSFFIPESVLSAMFRGKFLDALEKAWKAGKLVLNGENEKLRNACIWNKFRDGLYRKKWVAYVKETFNGKGKGKNRQEKDEDWEFTVKNMMIIRDLMQGSEKLLEMGYKEEAIGHNAIAAGVQGQRQWTDYKPNFDFPESMMCTSFDWNGPREAYTLATENDFLNGMSMLFGHLLTNRGVMFSDIRTYWSPEAVKRVTGTDLSGAAAGGFIHLINSGATTLDATGAMSDKDGNPTIKPFWEMKQEDVEACLKATSWMPADRDYFRGGGYSSHFVTKGGMPMTMLRLNLVAGLGPVLQLAEGWTVELDPKTHDILDKRTDPTWPTTWFAPRLDPTKDAFKDVYSVMNNWGANHGAICYGHVGADLITLCAMLRIPVCMHNIADKDIFRPACWNSFGMDKEGADYRACQNFGPIYK